MKFFRQDLILSPFFPAHALKAGAPWALCARRVSGNLNHQRLRMRSDFCISGCRSSNLGVYFCAGIQRFVFILGRFYIKINSKYQKVEVSKMSIGVFNLFRFAFSRAGPAFVNSFQKLRKEYLR